MDRMCERKRVVVRGQGSERKYIAEKWETVDEFIDKDMNEGRWDLKKEKQ